MISLLFRIETHARFLLGAFAFLTLFALLLFKTHLIQTTPSFDAYGWYAVNTVNSGMAITHRADNESTCIEQARPQGLTCVQGRSLNAQLASTKNQ